jgi:hypothetical protein
MPSRGTFTAVVDGLLADGYQVRFRAAGRSMLPTVRDGECLVVAPASARDVARGDVVLCATWRGPVAHRVVSVGVDVGGAPVFTLRGDASLELDRPVAAAQVRGRVVGVERNGRLRGAALPLGGVLLSARRWMRPALVAARAWLAPAPSAS